jgi:hypothetical protein
MLWSYLGGGKKAFSLPEKSFRLQIVSDDPAQRCGGFAAGFGYFDDCIIHGQRVLSLACHLESFPVE